MEPQGTRFAAIDILRGITLFLMLFVNDLNVNNVPSWLVHTDVNFDGMGLADWVFPGFLFLVGMSVPFAIESRLKKGNTKILLVGHIIIRTLSLLFIGVLMLNAHSVNPQMTGISKNAWALLMYISVFLVWNKYSFQNRWAKLLLRLTGGVGLVVLLAIFKGGSPGSEHWIKTGWWGILGLIGWGYLAASLVYLVFRENIFLTILAWLFFLLLNILSQLNLLVFLNPLKPVLGILIEGNTPFMVVSGLLFSLYFRQSTAKKQGFNPWIGMLIAAVSILTGFYLRNWFIISKIKATPSWGFICNGITVALFTIVYLITIKFKSLRWSNLFSLAGQNSLTTYLAPDILYYSIWMTSLPVFFYKNSEFQLVAVIGSLVWATAMTGLGSLLTKAGVRLKL